MSTVNSYEEIEREDVLDCAKRSLLGIARILLCEGNWLTDWLTDWLCVCVWGASDPIRDPARHKRYMTSTEKDTFPLSLCTTTAMLQLSWQPHPVQDPERGFSRRDWYISTQVVFLYRSSSISHRAPRERETRSLLVLKKRREKENPLQRIEDPFPLLSKYHPSFIYSQERFCGSRRRGEEKKRINLLIRKNPLSLSHAHSNEWVPISLIASRTAPIKQALAFVTRKKGIRKDLNDATEKPRDVYATAMRMRCCCLWTS